MPLYYFQVQSGRRDADRQALLLNSMAEARNHAKTIDGAIRFSDTARTRWAVVVRDEEGEVVYEIRRDH